MFKRLFGFVAVALLAVVVGCATTDPAAFKERYRTEMNALAATLNSTALLVQAGTVSKDDATKVVSKAQNALALLAVARIFQAPGEQPELDLSLKGATEALAALMKLIT